jgi:ribosome biogenesis GTPase
MSTDLSSLGWDDRFGAAYRPFDRPGFRQARVTRVDRGVCRALATTGALRASLGGDLLDRAASDPTALPCTGDWIAVRTWPDARTTIEAVLPRHSAIIRAAVGAEALSQVLAANIDSVAVVEPIDPEPDLGRIERLLALAWESGAQPVIVLTKADLAADSATVAGQVATVAPGVDVYALSTRTGAGLDLLYPHVIGGRTLGLLGASGSGKSSIVNALVGETVMGVRHLRADGRGRHTTTHRALVPVPGGGAVLDTPGIRAVGLFDGAGGLGQAFDDVAQLSTRCRFAGCRHLSEPGCAVRQAVDAGDLAPRRLESWRNLNRELAFEMRRRDARRAAQERAHRMRVQQRSLRRG